MAIYEVISPDGVVYEVNAPEGASEDQILAYAKAQINNTQKTTTKPEQKASGSWIDPVMQGLTFGWADELGGLGARLGQWAGGRNWNETSGSAETQRQRDALSAYREESPYAAPALEFASGMMSGGPLAKFAKGAAGLIGTGIGSGALYGAGATDGDKASGALVGGSVGGLLGGAVPAAAYGVRKGYGVIAPLIKNLYNRVAQTPTTRAGQVLAEDLATAGITPAKLRARQRQLGPQATVAEAADPAGITLGQGVIQADKTGAARLMAEREFGNRVPGMNQRIRGAAQRATGVTGRLLDELDVIKARQSAQAEQAYRQVYQQDIVPDDELVRIMNRPSVKKAIPKAIAGAKDAERTLPTLEKIVMQGDDWQISREAIPDMEALDHIKRTMDDMVTAAYRRGDDNARNMRLARDALRNKLDKMNPAYANARALYAGDAALEDALLQGEKIFTSKTREVAEAVRGMGNSEREAFLKGAVEAIREKVGRSRSGDMSGFRFLEQDNTLEKLRTVFPPGRDGDRALALLRREIAKERTLKQAYTDLTKGSQTALRQQAGERLASGRPTSAEVVMRPGSAGVDALVGKFLDAIGKEKQATVDELAKILFTPGNVDQAIALMEQRGVPQQVIRKYVNAFSRGATALSGPAGGVAGGTMQ